MSTFDHTVTVEIVSTCDNRACAARAVWPVYKPLESAPTSMTLAAQRALEARTAFAAWRAANGWTYWAGSRVPATLCPDHKPGPTSIKMQNYTPGQVKQTAPCFHGLHGKCPGPHQESRYKRQACECDCHTETETS